MHSKNAKTQERDGNKSGFGNFGRRARSKDWIEQMLAEDEGMPRKQRHTARRVYRRLKGYGYTGGYGWDLVLVDFGAGSPEGKLLELQTVREAFMVQMKNATQSIVSEMGSAARKAQQSLDLFGHATLFTYLGLGGFGASVAMFLIIVFLRKGILERDWLLFIPVAISVVVVLFGKWISPKSAGESA